VQINFRDINIYKLVNEIFLTYIYVFYIFFELFEKGNEPNLRTIGRSRILRIDRENRMCRQSASKRVSLYWKIRSNLTRSGSLTLARGQTEITKPTTTADNLVMLQ